MAAQSLSFGRPPPVNGARIAPLTAAIPNFVVSTSFLK
jgi:hypothetical protein